MSGPRQKRGRSEQAVETPPDFLAAVRARFGAPSFDLACTWENAKAPSHLSGDSLREDWSEICGPAWLNPPYGDIAPWVRKAAETTQYPMRPHGSRPKILVLVPASIGSEWFAAHVHDRALVLALRPRITFVGHAHPYPKDLMLLVYGERPGFELWKWKEGGTT